MVWCCWGNQISSSSRRSNAGSHSNSISWYTEKITEMLSLHKSVQIVVSPNRDNIKLYLQKVTNDISDNFMWLVDELEQKQIECPKVLIYVRDYQRCSEIYHLFMQSLGAKAYYPPCATKTSENRMVAMYHSGTSPSIQENVLSSLNDPNGKVRIIIATTALGMGVDIKGLHRIINYGPPADIESYMQELGRAGRDGKQSEALLMFHGRQLRHCTPEILEYLKSSSCRRSKLLELFDKGTVCSHNFPNEKHLCCDICQLVCTCETNNCPDILDSMNSLKTKSTGNITSQKLRLVSVDQKQRLKGLLKESQKMMRESLLESNPQLFYANVDNVTCFTNQLIEDAVCKCDSLFSVEDIFEKLSVWKVDHAHKIYGCLCQVFSDLEKP